MSKKRNTKGKQMILQILENAEQAFSQDDILLILENKIDRATIYRTLQSFEEEGLVHRILDDTGKSFFALCDDCCDEANHYDDHVHFKCITCGKIMCLDVPVHRPQLEEGYTVNHISYFISGYCKLCN